MMEVPGTTSKVDIMKYVYKFHQSMINQSLILVYEGEINQMITNTFTAMAERDMDLSDGEEFPLYKRLYHVMVECLQNVCKHAADSTFSANSDNTRSKYGSGIVMISEEDRVFSVITGNMVSNENMFSIKNIIDEVNVLDKDGIKELYKTRIKESRLSEKGGAGLGLIDMVKKTGNPLEYNFEPVSDDHSFFILKTKVS